MRPLALALLATVAVTSGACSPAPRGSTSTPTPSPMAATGSPAAPTPTPTPSPGVADPPTPGGTVAADRPAWLGTRPLPVRPDGFGEVQETPAELRDRRFPPPEGVDPVTGDGFRSVVLPVPPDVADRSTWRPDCPVDLADLRYVELTFWGFDARTHLGELLVDAAVADDLVTVFGALYDARFPIEEMRIVRADELDAPPTGDGNNTTAFVCRPTRGATSWSQHAYGRAVDVNPFHNPYQRGDVVLPELASAYLDRTDLRPGMVVPGDVVTRAFESIGWGWGGTWTSPVDRMHFSSTGR